MVRQGEDDGQKVPLNTRITWEDVTRWATHGNPAPPRRVEMSEEEWCQLLTDELFHIIRLKGIEQDYGSGMCRLFESGQYECRCCGTPLFDAANKYESSTGWPSFIQPIIPGVVAYHWDNRHGMRRVEVACNVCDAHLGHVFPDGREPSGLRFCINDISLGKTITFLTVEEKQYLESRASHLSKGV